MKEKFSFLGSSSNKNEKPLAGEMADVAIGAGLITLGPGMAESLFNETSTAMGADLSFLPQNEALTHALSSGLETVQGLTGIGVTGMLLYLGAKKMFKPLFEK